MFPLYPGILEGLSIEEVDQVLNGVLYEIIPILGHVAGQDHFCLMHVALLQRNDTFVCRWYAQHPTLRLSADGISFLERKTPLARNKGIIWHALDAFATSPELIKKIDNVDMVYDGHTQTYRIDDIPPAVPLKKAIRLYEDKELRSVLFVPTLFKGSEEEEDESLVGVFAIDSVLPNAFTVQAYREFLRQIADLFGVIIKTLHLGYYDYSLWPEGVFNQAFLWHFWKGGE